MKKYEKLTILVNLPDFKYDQFTYMVSGIENGQMIIIEQGKIKEINQYTEEKLTYWSSEFNKVLSRYNLDYKDVYFSNRYNMLTDPFKHFLRVGWIAKQTKYTFSQVKDIIEKNNLSDGHIINLIINGY